MGQVLGNFLGNMQEYAQPLAREFARVSDWLSLTVAANNGLERCVVHCSFNDLSCLCSDETAVRNGRNTINTAPG